MLATMHDPLVWLCRPDKKSLRGVVDFAQPLRGHREDADFVDAPEAILVRAQNAVFAVALAFKIKHRVDQVLQQPGPGDRAVFGDVAHDHHRTTGAFRKFH